MNNTLYVPFDEANLITAKVNDEVYVAMRPIVEAIGLRWASQTVKFNSNKGKWKCFHIETVAEDGKNRDMLFIPLKKLNGWLFSINPEKVKPEIKETVIKYQEECFLVLYEYWNKGEAIREQIQLQIDEWRKRDEQSFSLGSDAGKRLNIRKQEKHYIQSTINQLEYRLFQPDLFLSLPA